MVEPIKVEDHAVPGRWWTLPETCPKCGVAIMMIAGAVEQMGKPASRTRRFIHKASHSGCSSTFVLELPPRPTVHLMPDELDKLPMRGNPLSSTDGDPATWQRWLEPHGYIPHALLLADRDVHSDLWPIVELAVQMRDSYFEVVEVP